MAGGEGSYPSQAPPPPQYLPPGTGTGQEWGSQSQGGYPDQTKDDAPQVGGW
jgi:hypothetical protein